MSKEAFDKIAAGLHEALEIAKADTAPAELVTEEMIAAALTALPDELDGDVAEAIGLEGLARLVTAALRAVAPMIAAAEREACAQIADTIADWGDDWVNPCRDIAAAIRARGETP